MTHRRTKSKASRGIVTWTIRYHDRRNLPGRPEELKVDVRRSERIDNDHAAAMVAARRGVPLGQVTIVETAQT